MHCQMNRVVMQSINQVAIYSILKSMEYYLYLTSPIVNHMKICANGNDIRAMLVPFDHIHGGHVIMGM
jgi:hypothetical protein